MLMTIAVVVVVVVVVVVEDGKSVGAWWVG